MKKLIIQVIISSFFIFNPASLLFGQEKVVQGRITTFDSIPIVAASIKVKSTKQIVLSDTLGIFTVFCLPKDKLKVTAGGFSSQNVKIEEKIKYVFVNLKLKPGPQNRELAIGYGHVREIDKLDAMSSLNEKDFDYSSYSDIYELIRGRFPGVYELIRGRFPGVQVQGGEIIIRGQGSVYMSNAALLIVNGMPVDQGSFGAIHPREIKNINVLKGPSASIYGSRAANGVVIVELKDGKD